MDYKSLYAKLERHLDRIQSSSDAMTTLSAVLVRIVEDFRDELGINAARIYVREGDDFVLMQEHPSEPGHLGFRIPVSYQPMQELVRKGFVVHDLTDPGVDAEIERAIGVRTFAAVHLGGTPQRVMAFSLRDRSDRDHVVYCLNTIRHVVNLKLREERLEDWMAQARTIQLSLIPTSPPSFADYDIWGATVPAEQVGGDLYDFIPVSERSLAVAIADAAGHGLPAALQARDAIIGLRMSVEERWRVTATIEKLNKVVGHSGLISRFISLFYCEVEPNGNLIYCNAGHVPPLLFQGGAFEELSAGGLILGLNPDATYERGYSRMEPGAVLLAFTDGISEAESPDGEMFGTERLREIVSSGRWSGARELIELVFEHVHRHSQTKPPVDDQTVLVVLRRDPVSEPSRRPSARG